jgi:hypothetical protein
LTIKCFLSISHVHTHSRLFINGIKRHKKKKKKKTRKLNNGNDSERANIEK